MKAEIDAIDWMYRLLRHRQVNSLSYGLQPKTFFTMC